MNSRFSTEKTGAYIVNSPNLKKLWTLLENRVGSVTLEANCADEMRRTFDEWQDVEAYENAANKEIVAISLRARSSDFVKHVCIEFSPTLHYTVGVTIDCPDDNQVSSLKDKIVDILDGMKHQILSFWLETDFMRGCMALLCLVAFVMIIINVISYGSVLPPAFGPSNLIGSFVAMGIWIIISALLADVLSKLRARLLPSVYFAMGQGKLRYEDWRSNWRTAITLAVGTMVTAVIAVIISEMS